MIQTNILFKPADYYKPCKIEEAIKLLLRYGDEGQIITGETDILITKDPHTRALIDIRGSDLLEC